MKLNAMKTATATGLISLSVLAGSMAFAATDGSAKDAAELQAFLASNPGHARLVAKVESKTGGTVTSAEVDSKDARLIEFAVAMADGSEQELILNTADGKMMAEAMQDGDEATGTGDETGENEDDEESGNEG